MDFPDIPDINDVIFSKYTLLFVSVFSLVYWLRATLKGPSCTSEAKLNGKTVIITGGSGGMGIEIAEDIAGRGARVILACRNKEKGDEEVKYIKKRSSNKNVYAMEIDLESFRSIENFVKEFKKKEKQLDILINNAGVMAAPFKLTENGFETHFQVNYLGHFYLTQLLLDMLKTAAPSRIVNVTSVAYKLGSINFDDISFENIPFDSSAAYSQSKLAVLLWTKELAKKLEGAKVLVNCVHPGVVNTDSHRHMGYRQNGFLKFSLTPITWFFMKPAKDGAQTTIFCAVSENMEDISGKYYADCKEAPVEGEQDEVASKLFEKSVEWIKKSQ